MASFNRILLGMDLSDMDYHLVSYLQSFARWYPPKKVYAVHVSPALDVPEFVQDMYNQHGPVPMDEALKTEIQQELDHRLPTPDFPVEINVLEGPVTNQLLHWADVKRVDLAIVGKKDPSFGSGLSAKRFARKASCSVLFLPEHAHLHIRRILVPTDYSEDAKAALEEAIRLARTFPTPPEIVHAFVYNVPSEVHFDMLRTREEFEASLRKGAMEYHRRYIREIDTKGIPIIPKMIQKKRGNTAWHLHRYAKDADIDLIMIGAKGHNSLSSFLMGSVTESLLDYHNSTPILVLRKPVEENKTGLHSEGRLIHTH